MRLPTAIIPGTLLLISGCLAAEPVRELLADLPYDKPTEHPFHQLIPDGTVSVHELTEGWSQSEGEGRWMMGPSSRIRFYVVGTGATLHLRLSTNQALSAQGQAVQVFWNEQAIGSVSLPNAWDEHVAVLSIPDDVMVQGWNDVELRPRVTLAPSGGETRPLTVFVRGLQLFADQSGRQQRRWAAVQKRATPDPEWLPTAIAPRDPPAMAALPDVLLIIMDTARADHFGSFGYSRATSPRVDALANRGIRLTNVIAEAPYTRASMHGVLTGFSWRDHRVLDNDDRLPTTWITLPEILAGAGYQTVAIFDNAQVCEASGADQGFAEWTEAWKDPRRRGWSPEMPERLFHERLARGFDQRPAFVLVHTMPPHNPYLPGEEHDLWGTDYAGPITGRNPDIFAFDRGERPAEGADFDRLVDLYDGNLHRGDAMVGRMVDAWHRQARDRERVVIVISDHGEAFGEHGRFSHNTTVFDEMLHVPVVLHPAARFAGLAGSEGALRSLNDVMPILLNALGVSPPAGSHWPPHFLRVLSDPTTPRREIFVRAANGICGVRTPTHLAFFRPGGPHGLFDLSRDPAARVNLVPTATDDFLEHARRVRAFLSSATGDGASPAALSPEDEERLRSLGYL